MYIFEWGISDVVIMHNWHELPSAIYTLATHFSDVFDCLVHFVLETLTSSWQIFKHEGSIILLALPAPPAQPAVPARSTARVLGPSAPPAPAPPTQSRQDLPCCKPDASCPCARRARHPPTPPAHPMSLRRQTHLCRTSPRRAAPRRLPALPPPAWPGASLSSLAALDAGPDPSPPLPACPPIAAGGGGAAAAQ
jgi:hypothetical protein